MPAFSRSNRSLFFSRVGRKLSAATFMIMMSSVGLAQEPAAEAAAAPASENAYQDVAIIGDYVCGHLFDHVDRFGCLGS